MGDFDIKLFLFEIRDNWNDECILYTDENRLDKNDDVWSTMVEMSSTKDTVEIVHYDFRQEKLSENAGRLYKSGDVTGWK